MAEVELVHDGVVIELATNGGPPVGERGSLDPFGSLLFGDYALWRDRWQTPGPRQLHDMLERDGKAEALWQVLTLPLRWAPYSIEPADGDTGEAELVRGFLEKSPEQGGMSTPLDHVIAQCAGARVLRRAFFEKVWEPTVEGRVRLKKLAFRPAWSCTLRRDPGDGSFQGFAQRVPGEVKPEVFLPDKSFVYVHDQARAPLAGRSALETAYRCYESKQKVRFLWFTFLERAAGRWGIAKAASNDDSEADLLAKKVAGLKNGGVAGIHKDQQVDVLEPSSDGAAFRSCLDWLSAEMSGSVLAGFTDLTQQGSGKGSFALSADQSDFFLRSSYAALSELAAAVTTYVVADICRWNIPQPRVPTFRFGRLTAENAEAVQGLLSTLAATAAPNPDVPKDFLAMLLERFAADNELDADRLRKAIQEQPATAPGPLGQVQAGADAAVQLLADAGITPGDGTPGQAPPLAVGP